MRRHRPRLSWRTDQVLSGGLLEAQNRRTRAETCMSRSWSRSRPRSRGRRVRQQSGRESRGGASPPWEAGVVVILIRTGCRQA
jgi:hypothetical protein